jgi:branched-chain amino acid transport system substrate-binding protein
MTGAQLRWGLENMDITDAQIKKLGFEGVMKPVSTSCKDHMGAGAARVHTWDGGKWVFTSDWLDADMSIINPMVKAAADKYAAEKGLKRRPASDCSS